jgi:hypothetical protein
MLPINFRLLPQRRDFIHDSGIRAPTSIGDFWFRYLSKNLQGIKTYFYSVDVTTLLINRSFLFTVTSYTIRLVTKDIITRLNVYRTIKF